MTPKRPTGVTVVAIVNIILGALGVFGGLCGLGSPAIQAAMKPQAAGGKPDPGTLFQEELERQDPNSKVVGPASLVVSILLGAGLLASGIGLLKLRPWARTLAMTVAVIEIVMILVNAVYAVAVTGPATQRAVENVRQQLAGRMAEPGVEPALRVMEITAGIAVWISVGLGLLFLVYYIIQLLVLNGVRARAAFAGAGDGPGPDDDFDDRRARDEPEDVDDRRRDY